MATKTTIFTNKNLLIAGGVVVALAAFGVFKWAKKKQEQAITVFTNMRIKPVGIRNVRIQSGFLRFNLDLELFNPSNENLDMCIKLLRSKNDSVATKGSQLYFYNTDNCFILNS